MEKELIKFIKENKLSPFTKSKSQLTSNNSIFKTRDAKSLHNRVLTKISSNFIFSETSNLLNFFSFTENQEEIKKRQEFFSKIKTSGFRHNDFLKELVSPRPYWKPRYDVVVVTENTNTFNKLRERNCPVQLLVSETDVSLLESRDVVQVLDCEEFGIVLESLPQAIFLNNLDETYLERHLESLSGWKSNLQVLMQNETTPSLNQIVAELFPLIDLTNSKKSKALTTDEVEKKVEEINEKVTSRLRELTISGESLVKMLNKGELPDELKALTQKAIRESELPLNIVISGLPVKTDEEELEKLIQFQNANEYSNLAEAIKNQSNKLKQIPEKIQELSELLILFDFIAGISQFIKQDSMFPRTSENLLISNSKNIFLENAQPISFNLSPEYRCSILTGANSGGKTTLIEHILQIISLFQLGLPIEGEIEIPIFTDVYYFAKNKGSLFKGAFETLLSQMSKIKPGNKTLILADEIESVTEPGVAGNIISATADFYLKQNCFLVIATHLGYEIQKNLPMHARIDGIEAKGLTKDYELIVDHNPVLGRLAHSTPELIVEKMANSEDSDYFRYLNKYLKDKPK